MHLRFIDSGTNLHIDVLPDMESLDGIFFDYEKDSAFLVECETIYERICDANFPNPGPNLDFTFFRGHDIYMFTGRIDNAFEKNGSKLVRVKAISPLEKTSRRKAVRVEVLLPIKIYRAETLPNRGNSPGDVVCIGQTMDISGEGICLLSNNKITPEDGAHFFAEFTIGRSDSFLLPVKLMRRGDSPQSVQFKYDYGFLFEFAKYSDEKNRLIFAMFNYKMENS